MQSTPSSSTTATPPPHASASAIMPFGKYKGSPLSDLPPDYLLWVSLLPDLRQPLLGAILKEMGRRIVELDQPAQHEREAVEK